jgi:hypothetical protein
LTNISYAGSTDTYNLISYKVSNDSTVTNSSIRFDANRNLSSLNQLSFLSTTANQTPQFWVDDVKVTGYAAIAPVATLSADEE